MRRKLALGIVVLLLGDALLVASLKGRMWSLVWVYQDRTGAAFEAAPDSAMRVVVAGQPFDYAVEFQPAYVQRARFPDRSEADSGLADVRACIRWVRDRLRVGEGYRPQEWRLSYLLAAAADSSMRFWCDTYARALVAAAQSQGYAARVIHLEGHVTSEIFLPRLGQWVWADALYDFIARDAGGRPLSLTQAAGLIEGGREVVWQPVTGVKGDDDEMEPRTRRQVEGVVRRGNFFLGDGPFTYGRLSDARRALDLVAARPRVIQLAAQGEPALDRRERGLRWVLIGWNLVGLAVLIALAQKPGT